jgi:hypothetical protein
VHSDRGSQFRSHAYQRAVRSRRAARLDGRGRNLRRQRRHESFLSLLQKNVLNRRRWTTRHELRLAVAGAAGYERADQVPWQGSRHLQAVGASDLAGQAAALLLAAVICPGECAPPPDVGMPG